MSNTHHVTVITLVEIDIYMMILYIISVIQVGIIQADRAGLDKALKGEHLE